MKFFDEIFKKVRNLDKKVIKIMRIGFIFSFTLCLISSISLFTYEIFYSIPKLFYLGIILFRSSLMFACTFLICGIGFDTIKKEMI